MAMPGSEAGTNNGRRRWEDVNHDLLVSIFSRLDIEDLIAGVPYACSTWRGAARNPECWRRLDFRDWEAISRRLACSHDARLDFADLLLFCVSRGEDRIDSVHFPPFADEIDLLFVADSCPKVLYFSIENSNIAEDELCEAIGKLEFLQGMAVHENLINRKVLGHISRCCRYFSDLKIFADAIDEDMASIICKCLPNLRKLETMHCIMSRQVVLKFLDELKDLEYLDISDYENCGITSVVLEKASRLKVFRWESWDSRFDEDEFECCSDYGEDRFF